MSDFSSRVRPRADITGIYDGHRGKVWVADSQSFLTSDPYMFFFPGMAIVLTVLGFLLVGDGLRDALDVKDN